MVGKGSRLPVLWLVRGRACQTSIKVMVQRLIQNPKTWGGGGGGGGGGGELWNKDDHLPFTSLHGFNL